MQVPTIIQAYGQQAGGGQHGCGQQGCGQQAGGGQHGFGQQRGAQQGSRSQQQQLVNATAVAASATIELNCAIFFFMTTLLYLVCFVFRTHLIPLSLLWAYFSFLKGLGKQTKKVLTSLHTHRLIISPQEFFVTVKIFEFPRGTDLKT